MLEKYTTSVVGSYSVPRWYEALEKQVESGSLSAEDMKDAQFRASQAAILDQLVSGVDLINGGEMHRRTNNRHAPPNAMLNHFWEKIPGFSDETRPKPITPKDENVTHPGAVLTGRVSYGDLGLVDEFEMISAFTAPETIKITMTGPHMLAKVCHDEHYEDIGQLMQALAEVINQNLRELQAAGCRHIQLDEPLFAAVERDEVQSAVDALNQCFEGTDMYKWVHICQGNYSVSDDFDQGDQIGHRYFDFGEYPADLITKIDCDSLMVEYDFADAYRDVLGNQQLSVGAADVQDKQVENPEQIAERIESLGWLSPEQTLITSSCGLNHLSREVAFGKLKAMADAKKILS